MSSKQKKQQAQEQALAGGEAGQSKARKFRNSVIARRSMKRERHALLKYKNKSRVTAHRMGKPVVVERLLDEVMADAGRDKYETQAGTVELLRQAAVVDVLSFIHAARKTALLGNRVRASYADTVAAGRELYARRRLPYATVRKLEALQNKHELDRTLFKAATAAAAAAILDGEEEEDDADGEEEEESGDSSAAKSGAASADDDEEEEEEEDEEEDA
jgi:hypothetical protein